MTEREDILNTFGRHRHGSREDLVGEHPLGHALQIISFVGFLLLWVTDSFFLRLSTFPAEFIPFSIRLIPAIPLFYLAVYLLRSSHNAVFGQVREKPQVITGGVFSISRHPLYLSALLFYAVFFLTTLSLLSLAFLGCIFFSYNFLAAFEERLLEEKHGKEYREYKGKTRRWL